MNHSWPRDAKTELLIVTVSGESNKKISKMSGMPAFCPPNVSISDIWVNHGVSHCFMETVASSTIGGFILLFGLAQLMIYKKYSTRIDARRLRPSFLYKFQIFLMVLLPLLAAVRLDLRWKFYDGVEVYGFMVSCTMFALIMIAKKIYNLSDSIDVRHHLRASLRNLPDRQRASLPAPVSSYPRSRNRPADLLHPHVHRSECRARQYQFEGLVVQHEVEEGSDWDGAIRDSICLHAVHLRAGLEGARNHQRG